MPEVPSTDWTYINNAADRFERVWKADPRPRIDDYLAKAQPELRAALFDELMRVELELRRRDGEQLTAEEFVVRFPEHTDRIRAVFARDPARYRALSTEPAIDFGQKMGKVEHRRARLPCGLQVRAVPVALLLGELGIGGTGPAAGTMMLMVGQQPGQIAQPSVGSRGAFAPTVAGGAHHRAGLQESSVQLLDFGRFHRFKVQGGLGVLVNLIGVEHGHAGGADPLIGPERL
jgi:hypothetical protein